MTSEARLPPRTVLYGIFTLALATLVLEIAWLRVLSVSLWYHFAFIALSTAMFGFGLAAVVISLVFPKDLPSKRFAERVAVGTPLAFLAGFLLSNAIPFEPFSLGTDPAQRLYLPLFFAAVALPFFFSGLTIAAQGARFAEGFHRLYLFDLCGAGLGAAAVVFLLPLLGGAGTLLFAASLAAFGAALICAGNGNHSTRFAGVVGLVLLVVAAGGERLIAIRVSNDKVTGNGVALGKLIADPNHHLLTSWNSISRVDVLEWSDRHGRPERAIFIDGGVAVTRLPHLTQPVDRLPPTNDEESFFYHLHPGPDVLVVGSGGGREVLLGLRNGAAAITAVEINPDINEIASRRMADYTGHLFDDPRVSLYTDEARSFLNRSDKKFDIIHCPHTISNAAMSSGSLSLAENYLLTVEAFKAFFGHLTPNGILIITRPEAHLPRLISTLRAATAETFGDALSARITAWRARGPGRSFYAGIAVKQTAFSPDEIQRFKVLLSNRNLDAVYLPGTPAVDPYRGILEGRPLKDIPLSFATILDPATDDKPFFNRRIPFSAIRAADIAGVFAGSKQGRDALEDRPVTESALIVLLIETVAIALLGIVLPVVILRRKNTARRSFNRFNLSFFFLGLAFIFVEMGMIQRLTLYLGRPTVVYATVICSILCASGLGALVAGTRYKHLSGTTFCAAAGIAALLAALLIWPMVRFSLAAPLPLRIFLSILSTAIPGFFMGMPFPSLIRRLGEMSPPDVALGLGINGFAGTVGTVAAVLIAMTLGQTAVLLLGVGCYAAAAATSFGLLQRARFTGDTVYDKTHL